MAGVPPRSRAPVLAAGVLGLVVVGGGTFYLATRARSADPTPPVAAAPDARTVAPPPIDASEARALAVSAVDQAAVNGLVLSYRMLAKAPADAAFHVVKPGEALHTNTRVAFEVEVSEPAHVFLGQRTKGKQLAVLFPSAAIAVPNPLPANTWVRIPPTAAYRLNDQDLGEETVYLIASRKPLADLSRAVAHAGKASAPARAVEDQVVAVAMAKRSDCAGRPRNLTLDTDDDCKVRTRGLELEDDEPSGAQPARRIRGLADDDVVFVPFAYQHLP